MAASDLLRGCPLFFELFDKEIETLIGQCFVLSFEAGEKIIEKGSEGKEIFVVLEGKAQVKIQSPTGPITVQVLGSGDVFGEMVLLDEKERSADIVASEKTFVLEIPYEKIFSLFEKHPRIFGILVLNISRLLTKRLKQSNTALSKFKGYYSKKAA